MRHCPCETVIPFSETLQQYESASPPAERSELEHPWCGQYSLPEPVDPGTMEPQSDLSSARPSQMSPRRRTTRRTAGTGRGEVRCEDDSLVFSG